MKKTTTTNNWCFCFKWDLHMDGETLPQANNWASASLIKCNERRRWGIRESKADRWQFVKSWININYIPSVSTEKEGSVPTLAHHWDGEHAKVLQADHHGTIKDEYKYKGREMPFCYKPLGLWIMWLNL